MFDPGVPGTHFMQSAFLVDDLDEAARRWIDTTGIGPFFTVRHVTLAEYSHRGEPRADLDFSVAIAQSGGIQVELIQQHNDAPSAYRDTITSVDDGFHHFGIYTADYDKAYRHYMDRGFDAVVDAKFGDARFSYIDTRPAIGCMIELIEEFPLQTELFQRVAAGARDWDGKTDPIRPGFPE